MFNVRGLSKFRMLGSIIELNSIKLNLHVTSNCYSSLVQIVQYSLNTHCTL